MKISLCCIRKQIRSRLLGRRNLTIQIKNRCNTRTQVEAVFLCCSVCSQTLQMQELNFQNGKMRTKTAYTVESAESLEPLFSYIYFVYKNLNIRGSMTYSLELLCSVISQAKMQTISQFPLLKCDHLLYVLYMTVSTHQLITICHTSLSDLLQFSQPRPRAGTRTVLPKLPRGAPAQRPAAVACP